MILFNLPAAALGFSLCVQISALSWFLSVKFGLPLEKVGWIWAGAPLAGLVGQLFFGKLSDRTFWLGRRRGSFICLGSLLSGGAFALLPHLEEIRQWLGMGSIAPLAAALVLCLNIAINMGFASARALAADLTTPGAERTKAFAWQQAMSGSFGVLAYLIGAVFGNEILVYVGAILVPLLSWIPCLLIREPKDLPKAPNEKSLKGNSKSPLMGYLANGFSWFGMQVIFIYSMIFLKSLFKAEIDTVPVFSLGLAAMNTVGFILPPLIIAPLAHRFTRSKVCAASLFVTALSFLGIRFACGSSACFYLFMAGAGVGWGAMLSLPIGILSEMGDPSKMGFSMGIFNLSIVIPQLAASFYPVDPYAVFPVASAGLALSAVTWILIEIRNVFPVRDNIGRH